jgi:hypothetical protein
MYAWKLNKKSIIQGLKIKQKKVQEYLGRPTKFGRKYARHSTFHISHWTMG